jgi:long-chain acyl-CoA synthetase
MDPWLEKCRSMRTSESETLGDVLDVPMQIDPEKVAIHFEDLAISYRELDARANRVANALGEAGVRPGDRIAIHVDNRPDFIEIFLGVMRAGGVLVPTNVMYTRDELEHILGDSGARMVFVLDQFSEKLAGSASRLDGLEKIVEVGSPRIEGSLGLDDFLAGAGEERTRVSVSPDDVAIIQYTSGTTGKPKGAMVSHFNVLRLIENLAELPGLPDRDQDDVTLAVLPLFHSYALNLVINQAFVTAQSLVLVNRFDPAMIFELVEKHKVTLFYGAPPMFHAFVNTPGLDRFDISSLKGAYSGAAPLPVVILERFREMTGSEICEGYGLSETSPTLTSNAAGTVNKPGSVGPVIPEVTLRIVDENDRDVPPGQVGEIIARGPNIFKGYWNREEETQEAMRGGWFHTGDMGRVDEDGYYYIVDRKKDMIVVSGYNVYPIEVENVIMRHPSVVDAAVIGVPDDYQGESVKALLIVKEGETISLDELTAHCREQLAAFKVPKHLEIRDSLPKSPTGKVVKRELRALEVEAG